MPIAVICPGCNSRLNAPDAAAGKTVKCPKCKAAMVIPETEANPGFETVEEAEMKTKPQGKSKPAVKSDVELDDDEDDRPRKKKKIEVDDDEEDDKPRKKKGKKKPAPAGLSPVLVGAILGGVLLLGGGAFAVYWFAIREKPEEAAAGTPNPPFAGPNSKGGPPPGIPGPGSGGTSQPPTTPSGPVKPIYKTSNFGSRRISANNLKQIGIAFHNMASTYGSVPTGIGDATGNVGLSWRVAILPFVEEAELYRQFKLNEPWNSEHNKKLIPKMPKVFAAPGKEPNDGRTFYRSFAGPDTMFPPARGQAGQIILGIKLSGVPDGLSNTAMVVEAGDSVDWTKPDELTFSAGGTLPRVGGIFGDGYTVLMGDGSVRFVKSSTPPDTLKALITVRGGEIVDFKD